MSEAQPEVPVETPVETPAPETPTLEPAADPESSWRDGIDLDLRDEPTLKLFGSTTDLAKSYMELRRKMGDPGLTLPKPDASPAEVRAAMTEMGCPETSDAYDLGDFKPPEGLAWEDAFQADALQAMHHVGLNGAQARPLLEWFGERAQAVTTAQAEQEATQHAEWDQQLAKQWGTAAEKRFALAERAVNQALGESAGEIVNARLPNGGLLKHHPGFRDMLANVGDMMAEHGLLGDTEPARFSATPDGAKQKIEEFEADMEKRTALFDKAHPKHKQAAEEWRRLHEQAYPGRPQTGASTAVEIAT